jgi:hypothetical protein
VTVFIAPPSPTLAAAIIFGAVLLLGVILTATERRKGGR